MTVMKSDGVPLPRRAAGAFISIPHQLGPHCFYSALSLLHAGRYFMYKNNLTSIFMQLYSLRKNCYVGYNPESLAPAAILLQRVVSHSLVICDSHNVRFTGSGVM